jgi:hypothetical protein
MLHILSGEDWDSPEAEELVKEFISIVNNNSK